MPVLKFRLTPHNLRTKTMLKVERTFGGFIISWRIYVFMVFLWKTDGVLKGRWSYHIHSLIRWLGSSGTRLWLGVSRYQIANQTSRLDALPLASKGWNQKEQWVFHELLGKCELFLTLLESKIQEASIIPRQATTDSVYFGCETIPGLEMFV